MVLFQGQYYVKHFKVDDSDFPPLLRAGDYRLMFILYIQRKDKDVFLFRVDIALRLKAKSFAVF